MKDLESIEKKRNKKDIDVIKIKDSKNEEISNLNKIEKVAIRKV